METTRRGLLKAGAAVAVGAGVLGPRTLLPDAAAVGETALRTAAGRSGRYFGSSAAVLNLLTDPSYADLITRHCSVLAPENEFKWALLRPVPGQPYNFLLADQAVAWAEARGMDVRGNCFTWNNSNPYWFQLPQFFNPGNALAVLEEHITTVMTRYKGRVRSWDVVNEATNGAGYYPTPWAKMLGPRYIDNAFTIAHRADPDAQLVLNEYNLEYDNRYSRDRQAVMLRVLDDLQSRDVPVHALGVQAHLAHHAVRGQFDPAKHQRFLRSVASMGLKIVITELDITDQDLPGDVVTRDREIAVAYQRYLDCVLQVPQVEGVVSWGLSDKHSWLNSSEERFEREDGLDQRPLPFDDRMAAKPAYAATARALGRARRAAPRTR
ncbi:MAG: Endo,4-beta-xylanase [Frankiales bacterium]|nr:Endo,4-beta-xylanase [Frankiales bacterium]